MLFPSDTVKTLWEAPGLVKQFLLSTLGSYGIFYKDFSSQQNGKRGIKSNYKEKFFSPRYEALSKDQKHRILDAAIDYYDFKFSREVQTKDSKESILKDSVLKKK